MHALFAVIVANLPIRWWGPFEERLPLHRYAWLSGIAALLAGFTIGIPGYLNYLAESAEGVNRALIAAQSDLAQMRGWAVAALPIFLLASPTGIVSLYLVVTGLLRFASAFITDDPRGDPLLTALDTLIVRLRGKANAWDARKSREKLEGPEAPDRLVTGEWLDKPDVELAILASRRKPWPPRAYLVTADGRAYRIGEAFDIATARGLRTVYPLSELRTADAIRHAIPYELPPLWQQPRQ